MRQASSGRTTTQFLYDGDRLVAEYDGSTVTNRYVHGPGVDEPLVWFSGSGTSSPRWLHADHQGSIVAASDANGVLVGAPYTYGPYGEPDPVNAWLGSRFRYTGQIALPDAQRARWAPRRPRPSVTSSPTHVSARA